MKTKRSFLLIFTLCAALSLTACNGKQPANTEKPQDTQTESSTASSDDSSSELDDLYQQENQLFADHKDVWDKVFGMMSKSTADPSGNYADYLAGRFMLVRKAEMFPVECIVRGYLTGSGLKDYEKTGAVCGIELPAGLVNSSRLPEPIFTPSS